MGIVMSRMGGGKLSDININQDLDMSSYNIKISTNKTIDGRFVSGVNKWIARTPPTQINTWRSICYGNGLFVAVTSDGLGGIVVTSPNGITWTNHTAAQDISWKSVCYGNGLFVAVSYSGTNRVMTSPDGITWTTRTPAQDISWRSVCYGNGLFVAIAAYDTNRVMTSPDGITWTTRTPAQDIGWKSVCYGNGLFVAVSYSGTNRVMTSPDGITWTTRTPAQDISWSGVCYGNGLFVAVGYSGTNRVMTSPDGITWTTRTPAQDITWRSICYGNGIFVAVGISGINGVVMTSPDGATWTTRIPPISEEYSWHSVCYGNGIFVVVGCNEDEENKVLTSTKVFPDEILPERTYSGNIVKILSDNLRHSYDTTITVNEAPGVWKKLKTFSFQRGVRGSLRLKMDLMSEAGLNNYAHGRWYRNNIPIGADNLGSASDGVWVSHSEDINVGTLEAGDKLEVWGRESTTTLGVYVKNLRIYYDDMSECDVVIT